MASEPSEHEGGGMFRFLLGLAGLGVVALGIYLAWDIFTAVSTAVRDPQTLEKPHRAFADLIQAQRLGMRVQDQEIAVGPSVALSALWGWYLLWALIPMWIMAAGTRIVVAALRRG